MKTLQGYSLQRFFVSPKTTRLDAWFYIGEADGADKKTPFAIMRLRSSAAIE